MAGPRYLSRSGFGGGGMVNARDVVGVSSGYNDPLLPRWSSALAQVLAGTRDATIGFIGDSTVGGKNASSTTTTMPARVAARYSPGCPVVYGSTFGTGGSGTSYSGIVTLGSGWSDAFGNTGNILGGGGFRSENATGELTFAPVAAFDTIKVWYLTAPAGQGNGTINVDGGSSLGTITGTAANALRSATYTVANATHVIHITGTGGGGGLLFIMGIETYVAGTKAVRIHNWGRDSATSAIGASNSFFYSSLPTLDSYQPDLTFVDLTINDIFTGVSPATHASNMTAIYNKLNTYGDVIFMVGNRILHASDTDEAFNAMVAAQAGITSNGYSVNIPQRWGSFAAADASGFMSADDVHPNDSGYNDIATAVLSYL